MGVDGFFLKVKGPRGANGSLGRTPFYTKKTDYSVYNKFIPPNLLKLLKEVIKQIVAVL